MFSKVLSFLLYYPQVVFPVCGGAMVSLVLRLNQL